MERECDLSCLTQSVKSLQADVSVSDHCQYVNFASQNYKPDLG